MVNRATPDDPRAHELDKHFEAHVIESNTDGGDLYVSSHGEDPAAAADAVEGVEYVGPNDFDSSGFYFDYADDVVVVTIGSEEVVVRATSSGYEVTPRASDGFYVRAVSDDGVFGFEIPLDDADQFVIEHNWSASSLDPHHAAWNTDASVDGELRTEGAAHQLAEDHGFDGHAVVSDVEIVEQS